MRYPLRLPPLVAEAYRAADDIGFGADGGVSSCLPGVGAALAVLAASRPGGSLAELGTGVGAGSAWMLSGMDAAARLVTVELDEERAALAARLLATDDRVTCLRGRWEDELVPLAPFDIVFLDAGVAGHMESSPDDLVDLVRVGGLLVLDDLTPEAEHGAAAPEGDDAKRGFALRHPRLVGAELYPPSAEGRAGGHRSGLLVTTRVS